MRKSTLILSIAPSLISVSSFADDIWKEISARLVESDGCENANNFHNLFDLSVSRRFKGVMSMELLAEANERSFINCPKQFLLTLKFLSSKDQQAVFKYFGIVIPPRDIADALKPLKEDEDVGDFVSQELGGFLSSKKVNKRL